ncbi:MAG TPA: PH domain-containing protein [Tepidisphaeraceae bacterium]|jgi:membrane protein YdbS with pleckstrin-like domain
MTQPVDPTITPTGDDRPHRPADDREEVYYQGSPMLRGDFGTLIIWGILGLLLIAAPIVYRAYYGVWPAYWWITLGCIVLGVIALVIPLLVIRSTRYRISNYRIDFERGLLSRRIDTLELWHVEDISFHQSLLDRILGVGNIRIISHDETTPQLLLKGLPTPRPIFEQLKQRIIAVKRQRGVIKMDVG